MKTALLLNNLAEQKSYTMDVAVSALTCAPHVSCQYHILTWALRSTEDAPKCVGLSFQSEATEEDSSSVAFSIFEPQTHIKL